ncbi:hypothetical protein FB45DRAFT_1124347 [Roridomyces roridus]|uniref:F-box domain-containing protein n=1 Tax=Roridomyces roridus TaxID=1738132 RepID=A0AAD7C793_9AGAR|nr:hypothetical protein FB45DRAFT_1124347 [Roridomyces roridus]
MVPDHRTFLELCPRCAPLVNAPTADIYGVVDINPPTNLSRTNNPPSDVEVRETRQRIQLVGIQLVGIQLSKMELELDLTRKRTLFEKIALNCAILSPMRRAPEDVLLEIFAWVVAKSLEYTPSTRGAAYFRRSKGSPAPWNLSHVCSRWRALSVSSAALWVDISLHGRIRRDFIEAQLKRSSSRALRISVNWSSHGSNDEIFGLLATQAHRWQSIHLVVLTPAMLYILNNNPTNLTRLCTFSVGEIDPPETADVSDYRFLLAAAKLSTVLVGSNHETPLPFEDLRLNQLRISHDAPWRAVGRHLQQLTLLGLRRRDYHIVLPALISLKTAQDEVLESLTTPALQNLHFGYGYNSDHPQLVSFIRRSGCTLRRLSTDNTLFDMGFLRHIPTLWELGFKFPFPDPPAGFSRLLLTPSNPIPLLLPALRVLWVSHIACGEDNSVLDLLEKVVNSRRESRIHPTPSVSVLNSSSSHSLKRLGSKGMIVELWENKDASRRHEELLKHSHPITGSAVVPTPEFCAHNVCLNKFGFVSEIATVRFLRDELAIGT